MSRNNPGPAIDLQRIPESAQRLGVELDEEKALQWLTAIRAAKAIATLL